MNEESETRALLSGALGLEPGQQPFPWQERLLGKFAGGHIPRSLDIPTGLGKTEEVLPVCFVERSTAIDQITPTVERQHSPGECSPRQLVDAKNITNYRLNFTATTLGSASNLTRSVARCIVLEGAHAKGRHRLTAAVVAVVRVVCGFHPDPRVAVQLKRSAAKCCAARPQTREWSRAPLSYFRVHEVSGSTRHRRTEGRIS